MKPLVTEPIEAGGPALVSQAGAPVGRFASERRANAVERWSVAAAVLLAAFYLVSSLYIAAHRLFWYDEILTVHVARLPRWTTVWQATAHAVDGMSPVYDMVVRASEKLFGQRETAARLPSALAMAAGMLVTFDCARRLSNGVYGLMALAVLSCSMLPNYGYEARSYALYFLFSALSLWVWACTPCDSKRAAMAFGAVLFLAVSIHYYAFLILAPYAVWELAHWRPWQRLAPKLLAGAVGVAVPLAVMYAAVARFLPMFSSSFWAAPTLSRFLPIFGELFPDMLFLLALIAIWAVLATRKQQSTVLKTMAEGESVGWLFLCIPVIGFVLSRWTHHFLPRYFIGALPGVAVALACWFWRHFHYAYRVPVGALLLLIAWGGAQQAKMVRQPEVVDPDFQRSATRHYLSIEPAILKDGKRYFVFRVGMLHMEAQFYSQRPQDCVVLLPFGNWPTAPTLRQELNLAQYYPLQFWKLDELKEHAREAALIDPRAETIAAMREAGFQVELRYAEPIWVVYLR